MFVYILRRIFYAIPILIGINLITFLLFFMVNSPDDIARFQLGQKHVTPQAIELWKQSRGYDKPFFYNPQQQGLHQFIDTLFFQKSIKLFTFDFGRSLNGRDIGNDIQQRKWPSLALAIPTLFIGLAVNIIAALFIVLFRGTNFDAWSVAMCIILMSISSLFFIIAGQYLFSKVLRLVPISGYQGGFEAIKFLILPIILGVVTGIGTGVRWYRSIFLEEMHRDYVRTARAKGLTELGVLFKHILKNAMIPILTGVVAIIPLLFLGSLIMESFFGIPGLGYYTIDAINQQDFDIVRTIVFLGSLMYIIGLILTDISYSLVDPRVRLK